MCFQNVYNAQHQANIHKVDNMKTQYIARASIEVIRNHKTQELGFIVFSYVKVTNARQLLDLIADVAEVNSIGVPTIQLIPSTKEAYKNNIPFIPFSSQLSKAYRDWETDRKSTRLNSSHRL